MFWRTRPRLRRWYFATNASALRHAFPLFVAAVRSARANTSLEPVCLLEARDDYRDLEERLAWLRSQGVRLVRRRAVLFDVIEAAAAADDVGPYNGHWLRCEIPGVEKEDRLVLYTDIDVLFRRDVVPEAIHPRVVACAPEFDPDELSYFNSGVMLIDVPRFAAARPKLVRNLRAGLPLARPWDDQSLLNQTFAGRWDRLPNAWNWKPYWGFHPGAAIVHFHGLKPDLARALLAQQAPAGLDPEYARLLALDPAAYADYLREFDGWTVGSGAPL